MRRGAARFVFFAVVAAAACQHWSAGQRDLAECPGALRPVDEFATDFRLDQRVRIRAARTDASLRLAVEKRGSRLVVIGLNALGAKLFTVIQTGGEVEIESLPAAVVPVPPLNILRDLHRVRFLATETPPDARGLAHALRDGTRITEQWSDGVLRRRTFARVAGAPHGEVSVEFGELAKEGFTRVRIENGWCGYTAIVDTLVDESLR